LGLFSVLFGASKLRKPNRDKYFAIVTAADSLRERSDIGPAESAGLVFNPVESTFFENLDSELRDLLKISGQTTGTKFEITDDGFGTRWVVLEDPDFEDLVTTIHMIGETITDHGFGDRLLAAVFRIDFLGKKAYWIYSIKKGTFYPLVLSGEHERDNAAEMRLGAIMEDEKVPVEGTLEQWYALSGIPF
jgi:hypothetical protein